MNILIYGLPGSGKKQTIQQIIQSFCKCFKPQFTYKPFDIYCDTSNKKVFQELFFRQNEHIYEFYLQSSNMDRLIIRDIIGGFSNKYYICNEVPINKIIILYNIESLSEEASVILNVILSRNIRTCRFVLVTNKLHCISPKLRSACAPYKITRPQQCEMVAMLQDVCQKENVCMSPDNLREICIRNDCNIYECITDIQFSELKIQKSRHIVFERIIDNITKNAAISSLRTDIYLLLINNIASNIIIQTICFDLLKSKVFDITTIQHILHISCIYECRTYTEERALYHIEAYVYKLLVLLHENTVQYSWCKTI